VIEAGQCYKPKGKGPSAHANDVVDKERTVPTWSGAQRMGKPCIKEAGEKLYLVQSSEDSENCTLFIKLELQIRGKLSNKN